VSATASFIWPDAIYCIHFTAQPLAMSAGHFDKTSPCTKIELFRLPVTPPPDHSKRGLASAYDRLDHFTDILMLGYPNTQNIEYELMYAYPPTRDSEN
jgi:hypothetical protein